MIKVGDKNMVRGYAGNKEILRIYEGETLVWEKQPPSPESFRPVYTSETSAPYGFYEYLPEGYETASDIPLLVFLHGAGERGNGEPGQLERVLEWGVPKLCDAGTWHENFVMLAPQWLGWSDDNYYSTAHFAEFLAFVKQEYKVDSQRVYVIGLSGGGWYVTWYLEHLPDTHGIAGAILLSTPLEVGYSTPEGVAASGCPMWFLSNIGDPQVAWDNTYPLPFGYSVVGSRDAINSFNPIVERLTGFDIPNHEGSWDGICSGTLIGQANVDYDPFDEPIYDWLLSKSLPEGRTFS